MFRFLEWKVYRDSKNIFGLVLKLVSKLPRENRYDIGSQILRSALSISLNIAEGSGKNSDKDMNRFFNIALGSIHETVAVADILKDNKMITHAEFNDLYGKLHEIMNQLGGFKKKLK